MSGTKLFTLVEQLIKAYDNYCTTGECHAAFVDSYVALKNEYNRLVRARWEKMHQVGPDGLTLGSFNTNP